MSKRLDGIEPPPLSKIGAQSLWNQALDWISEFRGRKVVILDCACGDGDFAGLASKAGYNVLGVDASIERIKKAKRFSEVIAMDATSLGFKDKAFDAVVSIETIEHLTRPYDMLNEFARVIKEHGILIISTPNLLSLMEFYVNWRRKEYAELEYHRLGFTRALFEQALTLTGFKVIKFRYLDFVFMHRRYWIKIPLWIRRILDSIFGIWCRHIMMVAVKTGL